MRKLKTAFRFTAFILVAAVVVGIISRTLTPSYIYGEDYNPMTTNFRGFYEMERDSVDVLLIGSSQLGAGISAQDLYDAAGIRSYGLTSNNQAVWASYYWLKEALQYQSPKVVVFETFSLFIDQISKESERRVALDDMRLGPVKLQAVQAICKIDGSINPISYVLTFIRYHSRWSELEEKDFTWASPAVLTETKGSWIFWDYCGDDTYVPLTEEDLNDAGVEEFDAAALEYLDKMVDLCEENDIELVLLKTPTHAQSAGKHNAVQSYADEHGLAFYDFNMEDLYTEIDFDYATDMGDSTTEDTMLAHANPSGARKMSCYLAEQLLGRNGIEAVEDSQWADTSEFNDYIMQDFELRHENDLFAYLERIDQDRYSVFITLKDEGYSSSLISDEVIEAVRALGFDFGVRDAENLSWLAVKTGDDITELIGAEVLTTSGTIRSGRVTYTVTAASHDYGNYSSIIIDFDERSTNDRGLNIIVYDNEMHIEVDRVSFDIYSEELTARRYDLYTGELLE